MGGFASRGPCSGLPKRQGLPRYPAPAGKGGKQQDQGRTPLTFFGRDRALHWHTHAHTHIHSPMKSRTAPTAPHDQAHTGLPQAPAAPRLHTHSAETGAFRRRQGGFSAVVAPEMGRRLERPQRRKDPVRKMAGGECQGPAPAQGDGLPGPRPAGAQ